MFRLWFPKICPLLQKQSNKQTNERTNKQTDNNVFCMLKIIANVSTIFVWIWMVTVSKPNAIAMMHNMCWITLWWTKPRKLNISWCIICNVYVYCARRQTGLKSWNCWQTLKNGKLLIISCWPTLQFAKHCYFGERCFAGVCDVLQHFKHWTHVSLDAYVVWNNFKSVTVYTTWPSCPNMFYT